MSKKIVYINESALNCIKESVLKHSLPVDISNEIIQNKTSIGNNPAIPDIYDVPFIYKLIDSAFVESKEALESIGTINDIEDTTVEGALATLLERCKKEEKPYRSELEKLCLNYLIDFFNIPADVIDITLSLTDEVDLNKEAIRLDPIAGDGNDSIEFNDVNDAMSIKKEVYKRRLLDALAMGAGLDMSQNFDTYADDINNINPNLMDLYQKIIALNTYLLFTNNQEMTDENKMQIGTVELSLGKEDDKARIEAQGVIFPILLSEAIRGCMELFMSHGLPEDIDRANAVISKSDYLKAEPWDMRIGPSLWRRITSSFNDISSKDIPYIFKRIASLDIPKFNYLMKEVFAKTKKGKEIMFFLSQKAKEDEEYERFTDKMDKMKANKGVIADECLREDELKGTDERPKAYIMIGIPGSGKSTWVKNNLGNIEVVSRDIIRAELGHADSVDDKYVGTKEQEEEVTRAEYQKMQQLADSKTDFVIDDTNTGKYRSQLINFLRNNGMKIIVVRLNTDIETCIKRRNEQIPSFVIRKIQDKLVEPNENEYDDIINV